MAAGRVSDEYFYKEHPKTCAPDDFWGQVRRTVDGQPVGDDQIDLIVTAVREGLALRESDLLLDLCCGNGALTTRILRHCSGGTGVDFSDVLIDVALKNFHRAGRDAYLLADVEAFVSRSGSGPFTKALCYGSFQYLSMEKGRSVLANLRLRFPDVQRVFLGNLPDRDRIRRFFGDRHVPEGCADDPGSPVGIWRTRDEFARLALETGWHADFHQMPQEYYAAHYRYDAILTPRERRP